MCCCERDVLVTIDVGLKSMKRIYIYGVNVQQLKLRSTRSAIKPGSEISLSAVVVTGKNTDFLLNKVN